MSRGKNVNQISKSKTDKKIVKYQFVNYKTFQLITYRCNFSVFEDFVNESNIYIKFTVNVSERFIETHSITGDGKKNFARKETNKVSLQK